MMAKTSIECALTSQTRVLRIAQNEECVLNLRGIVSESHTIVLEIFVEAHASLVICGRVRVSSSAVFTLEIVVVHEGDRGMSRIDVRAVVYDMARMVSLCRLVILPTFGVDAAQYTRVLLVGDRASGHAEPIIEVEAHDVVCKHGSAVAPVPPEEMLFLQSRGIHFARARELCIEAFLAQ
jgi:Fe-S cluster assembly scaffold protein SufB